jgi:HD-GYP domain-containing protein (c-di-GMP phosphodiesterase class II)
MKSSIRLKTTLMILPVLVASLAIVETTSLYAARSGMMRLAMKALAFKAETLKQYGDEQWNLLLSHGFTKDPDFRLAAQNSMKSQARALIRTDSEWFFAVDLDGKLVMSASQSGAPSSIPSDLIAKMRKGITGAIVFGEGPGTRYGQAFFFEPFAWYVVASEGEAAIFAETNRLTSILLWTLALSVLVALALLSLLARSIAGPIVRLSGAMTEIIRSNDFGQRIDVASNDEIGALTMHFNALCVELDRSYKRIGDIAVREAEAKFELVERELETLIALGKVAEFRDENTGYHIVRSGLYTKVLARDFYDSEEERRVIYCAAPLHDIGKIGIPDSVLLKPGALSPEEFELMKSHTTIGYSILKEFKSPSLAMGATIALTHHERYDGTGYPKGLGVDEIPLCGRILAIIDVFDAITSKRPYKEAWPADRAFEYIRDQRGGHFDPKVTDSFLDHRPQILEILSMER